jgi:hypothetical protein
MKKLIIIILILLNGFLFADDLYFKNGTLWENCKVASIKGNNVKILFNEIFNELIWNKTIKSIEGVLIAEYDLESITKISEYNIGEINTLKETLNIIPITNIRMYEPIKEIKTIYENFGQYSQSELLSISKRSKELSENEKILYYYSMRKTVFPECLMNAYGLASMSQGDYGHGAVILAAELLGTLFLSLSSDETVRTIGFGLVGAGLIYGFIRPTIYADNYNKALKVGLEINYEF